MRARRTTPAILPDMPKLLTRTVAALTLAAIGACTNTGTAGQPAIGITESAPPPSVVKIGQPLNAVDVALGTKTVASVTLSNPRLNPRPSSRESAPLLGQFVAFTVSVTVKQGAYTPQGFALLAANGVKYDPKSAANIGEEDLYINSLPPGETVTKTVLFDTPKGAHVGAKVVLYSIFGQPNGSQTIAGTWTL